MEEYKTRIVRDSSLLNLLDWITEHKIYTIILIILIGSGFKKALSYRIYKK